VREHDESQIGGSDSAGISEMRDLALLLERSTIAEVRAGFGIDGETEDYP
jgi:hypothetical protein